MENKRFYSSMNKTINLFLLYTTLIVISLNKIKCDQSEYDLIHSILRDYDSSIRPSLSHNYTLNVTFGLALTQLIDVVSKLLIIFARYSFYYYFFNIG